MLSRASCFETLPSRFTPVAMSCAAIGSRPRTASTMLVSAIECNINYVPVNLPRVDWRIRAQRRGTTMRKTFGSALALLLTIISNGGTMAQTQTREQEIWTLLDDSKAAYVSL